MATSHSFLPIAKNRPVFEDLVTRTLDYARSLGASDAALIGRQSAGRGRRINGRAERPGLAGRGEAAVGGKSEQHGICIAVAGAGAEGAQIAGGQIGV